MAKKDLSHIKLDIKNAHDKVTVGQTWYHYKNPEILYTVKSIAVNVHDEKILLVNYQAEGQDIVWARTLDDFLSIIMVDNIPVSKFNKVD